MTQAIESSIFGNVVPTKMPTLSASEWLRLARYLGQFSETFQPLRPGQIANLHQIEQASSLMLGVSHLLENWPTNFHLVLAAIQRKSEASPSIRQTFGTLYRVLYSDLRAEGFQFLRDAFEWYLREHWWGVVCKRNRALKSQTIAEHPRLTLRQAAQQSGVTPATVRRLVQADLVPGVQFLFPSGRKGGSIHREGVTQLSMLAKNCLTISQAAKLLAIQERRVRELIEGGIIVPLVSRTHDKAAAWLIPPPAIQSLYFAGGAAISASTITVGRVLRFWRLRDGEFIALVQAMVSEHLVPVSNPSGSVQLGNVLLNVESARAWLSSYRSYLGSTMTIDQAAQRLGLKQQVAYDLARRGLLATVKDQLKGSRVTPKELEAFRLSFISLAEFAQSLQHSPKWVLQNMRVTPITGPSVDGDRQYFLRRSDIFPALGQQ